MRLPTLYKEDVGGKRRYWTISCKKDTMKVRYGIVDGKEITSSRVISGKNKGRSNETSNEEQAKLECRRTWTKKLEGGYAPDEDDAEGQKMYKRTIAVKTEDKGKNIRAAKSLKKVSKKGKEINDFTVPGDSYRVYYPLLAPGALWDKSAKCLKYFDFEEGVYVQPKLDGTRALAQIVTVSKDDTEEKQIALTSRSGKQWPWLKHIREELLTFLEGYDDIVLDGELYVHAATNEDGDVESDAKFQYLQEMVKSGRSKPHEYEEQVEYHVFDSVHLQRTQVKRFKVLEELFSREDMDEKCPHIKYVRPKTVYSTKKIPHLLEKRLDEGYEGIMIRAHDCIYTNKANARCLKMRKLKIFEDSEFEIIDFDHDKGTAKQYFSYVCVTAKGKKFKATSMGTEKERIKIYRNREEIIGKMLTVTYQGISKDGIPRFPKGKGVRVEEDLDESSNGKEEIE